MAVDAVQFQRPSRQAAALVRRLHQPHPHQRVRHLVQILHHALDAGVHQVRQRIALVAGTEDQAGDVVQQAGLTQAVEGLAWMLARLAQLVHAVEQFEDDEFLAGADDVGREVAIGAEAEEVPRFVDGLGAAGHDQRPIVAQLVGVDDHFISAGTVNLHAADKQHLRQLALDARGARLKICVPLRQHDARVRVASFVQGRRHGPRPGREQAHVGK